MADLSSLEKKYNQYAKNLEKSVIKSVKAATTDLVQNLVFNLAIDTGRARSNYIVSLNAPHTYALDESHAIGKKGSTATQVNTITLAKAVTTISGYKINQSLYIANNVHYLKYIVDRDGYDINKYIESCKIHFSSIGV
jgi:hypothetical protein